jgi:SLOG family YspA-like protein
VEIALVIREASAPGIYTDIANLGAGKMRVLVCGGRDFDDAGLMISVLDRLHAQKSFTVLIHGDARGADRMAGEWATRHAVDSRIFVPDYDQFGPRLAPPFRNQRMLDEGKPDLVVAFPCGGGTKDMVRRAVSAGVAIHEVNGADDW